MMLLPTLATTEVGDEISLGGGPLLGLDPNEELTFFCYQKDYPDPGVSVRLFFEVYYFGIYLCSRECTIDLQMDIASWGTGEKV